jgi:hypothetical protein
MKVFVVLSMFNAPNIDFCYDMVGVCTSLEMAQEKMKECHNKFTTDIQSLYECEITDNFVEDTQCLLVYKTQNGVDYVEERHLVVIEEREVED